ncbi:MAG: GNAT family N-acetyltransferase [Candidatus Thorarchaeota archaeon]
MKVPEMIVTNRLILRPFPKESPNEFLDSYRILESGISLVISSKENELVLGTCGLYLIENGISIGCVYALLPEFRGNGYAIEAMQTLIEYAFTKLEFSTIIAYIHPNNTDGWKVAERIGMKYLGDVKHKDFSPRAMFFTIKKAEFLAQRCY